MIIDPRLSCRRLADAVTSRADDRSGGESRLRADGHRHRRRSRSAASTRDRRHRRNSQLHFSDAGATAGAVRVGRTPSRRQIVQ